MEKTQWHPAFCAAMRLELKNNKALTFTNEFNLTEKPLEVDMLIIHKEADVPIDNPIGEFFGKHNLLEYKSPTDHDFNKFAIHQALSYAYYYCDRFQTEDVTVSLITSKSHFNFLKWFEKRGMTYKKRHKGIYTLHGFGFMKVQLVVTEEIDGAISPWLSSLTDKLTEKTVRELVTTAHELTENEEKRLAEAIVQVIYSANHELFEKMKEDEEMASPLFELMKPEIDKYAEEYAEKYAEKYAEEYANKRDIEHVKAMILHGDDNAYIRLIMNMPEDEIDNVRKSLE